MEISSRWRLELLRLGGSWRGLIGHLSAALRIELSGLGATLVAKILFEFRNVFLINSLYGDFESSSGTRSPIGGRNRWIFLVADG